MLIRGKISACVRAMCYGLLCVCTLAQAGEPAQALETVSLQLKWSHAFQFAGYYAALEQGYYREAGLDVRLLEAGPGLDPLESVLSGQAQYGVGTSSLLLARAAGQPVVVLAVVFQHSPLVLVARQDLTRPGTQGIHDLVGKRVMIEPQSDELVAYLKQEGINLDRLGRVLAALRRDGGHGALMFLDLDNFKPLNDSYGHAVGDLLLVEVARRLCECVREMDTVARFGGDEFVVLLGRLDDDRGLARDHAERLACKILDRVGEPYRLARAEIETAIEHCCTASLGVAVFNEAADEEDILRRADTAMYAAKGEGRNRIAVDAGLPEEAPDRETASHVDRRASHAG